ncbi:MAG: tRNA lysidine(34) synthetase TilS [Candidatus Omnitrophica bacterium]|nr:tRNA lysidine(34) synthetase TilS [Candidatus Omnitrophota bacterium]
MLILKKLKDSIRRHNLIAKNDKILIGVSGGADSLSLLYLLNSLRKEFGITLHIAHLDHMLRKDSAQDAEFVRKLAQKLKLAFTITRINVKKQGSRGSLEELARNVRLNFLIKLAKDIKAQKIALAHNLDDQAETVLMRILRGTGLYGLSGILPKRKMQGVFIIRPMLEIKRREIESFLNKKKIKPRIDPTNLEDLYLRNRIRHNLLPLLELKYNRNIKEILSSLAQTSASDYEYLEKKAQGIMRANKTRFKLDRLIKLHPAILRLKLRGAISCLQQDTRRITFQHLKEIEDLIFNRPIKSIVDLPKGISVIKKVDSLIFYRR